MAENILSRIKPSALHRIDVGFNMKKSSINTFIGREAHLQFLENEAFMRMVNYLYPQFFT